MTKMSASISVVIPCYNAAAFLREAIDSALAQTRPADEIIVVDDASTDGSVEVALSYGDRIKLLRSPNARGTGHGATANRGIMASRGDYIAFLHADDIWLPSHLEKVAGLLDKWHDAGVAFGRMECFGERNGMFPGDLPFEWDIPADVFFPIMRRLFVLPSSAMVRRYVVAGIGGFDEARPFYADDFDFFARCSIWHKFVGSSVVSARYRTHSAQLSVNRHDTLANTFRYRVRILDDIDQIPQMQSKCAMGVDRAQRYWEEEIARAWQLRNMPLLRTLVKYGISEPIYREGTRYYALRCWLPNWVLRLCDQRRGFRNRRI